MAEREGQQVDTLPSQQYLWDGTKPVKALGTADGASYVSLASSLVDIAHDAKLFTWTTGQLTSIKYYVGGLAGTLVLTVTLGYDVDGNLASMVRS